MRYLAADDLRQALPMADCIEAMRAAFSDDREVPPRVMLGTSLFMPARVGAHTGIKVVSTVPGNPVGVVAVFGGDGTPLGIVDGPTLTAIRTAAGAGLATDLLARTDSKSMAMLGAGAMAYDQVEAIRAVRPLERIRVWSRTTERAAALADRVGGEPATDSEEAVSGADVISCATPSKQPLFSPESVQTGTHINAIGAFTPDMCEVPADTVRSAFVVVDDRAAAAAEAGDLIQAGKKPDATMADLLDGRLRRTSQPITLFKSVGIGSQDVAAAVRALENAAARDIGLEL
ncbi:MAG: ornithine cyclodeaminase family protein [Acidimicrobiia bacterium]